MTRPGRSLGRAGTWGLSLAAAALLPAVIWVVTDPIAGHGLVAESGGRTQHITLPWVLAGGLITGALGLGLATLLRRVTRHARLSWLIVSSLALVLSLATPLGGTTVATVVVLMSMHLVVGAAIIPGGAALAKREER